MEPFAETMSSFFKRAWPNKCAHVVTLTSLWPPFEQVRDVQGMSGRRSRFLPSPFAARKRTLPATGWSPTEQEREAQEAENSKTRGLQGEQEDKKP